MAVTKTNNLSKGMKDKNGSTDILELQKALNNTGYGYNLALDGIVGTNTWGALTKGAAANQQTTTQTPVAAEPEKSYRYDAENDPVYQQAVQNQQQVQAQEPEYKGTYDQQVKDLWDQVMNQKDFSYDLNGDALWQQYKDQYTTQGKLAMLDAMGQAAALTGGYGSSYSQTAGQQAYQGHLQQLNDRVPELYQLALQKYNNDQAMLKDKLSVTQQMQADEYGKYQDAMSQHNIDLDRAQGAVDTAYDQGYNAWATEEQLSRQDEETSYNRQQDSYNTLANLIATTGYKPSQEELAAAGMTQEQATAYGKVYSDSKKTRRSSGGGNTKWTIPSEIKSEMKDKTPAEKNAYISQLEHAGVINSDQASYMRQVYDIRDVEAEIRELAAGGVTDQEFIDYLNGRIAEGYLTSEDAYYWRDQYGRI